MPDGQDLPFPAYGIDGRLHGAPVMVFQKASRLTKMCVLPENTRWLYHAGGRKIRRTVAIPRRRNDFDYRGKRDRRQSGAGGSGAKRRETSRDVPFQRGGGQGSGRNRSRGRG